MGKAKSTLGFEHKGIASSLKGARFAVPPNQREYSWEAEHAVDLFQDIANSVQKGKPHYFLGTIVLSSRPDVPEVVDGQQRLATTTILLAAIRDRLKTLGEDILCTSIENDFLYTVDRDNREIVPRLTLNTLDRDFFRDRVLAREDSTARKKAVAIEAVKKKPSHRRIETACSLAIKRVDQILAGHPESRHADRLNEWLTYLESSACVILLTVPDELNAYVMFETLNDRGLKD